MGENVQQLDYITHSTLIKIADKFIVHGLYQKCSTKSLPIPVRSNTILDNSGLEIISDLWNTSDLQLRMYGSAEELTEELKVFRSFPSSNRLFDLSMCEIYITPSTTYSGSSGSSGSLYCYKQDFIPCMGTMPFIKKDGKSFDFIRAFVGFLMRHENRVSKLIEMIRIGDPAVRRFRRRFSEYDELTNSINRDETFDPDCNLSEFLEQWKGLVPFMINEEDFTPIIDELTELFNAPDYQSNVKSLQLIYTQVVHIYRATMAIIGREDKVLQPYEVSQKPKMLRAFIDEHGDWLVMVIEAELMLKKKLGTEKCKHISTISKKELIEKQPALKSIEFVQHRIVRTKHRFVPVMDPFGRHCILAADSFIETMRDLFFGVQLFQKIEMESWYLVEKVFSDIQSIYDTTIDEVYFINYEEHRSITQKMMKSFPNISKIPAKSVRNAKKDGFTLQNLKNELVHLGLNKIFPEIDEYAQASYERVCSTKKQAVLRTCDLFEAIEHCQLASLRMRFTFLAMFIHVQQACYRFPGTVCVQCEKDKPQPSYTPSEWREIMLEDVELSETKINNGPKVKPTLTCRDGTVLLNNFMLFSSIWPDSEEEDKMLMIDKTTARMVQHYVRGLSLAETPMHYQIELIRVSAMLLSLFPLAKLYLRTVPTRAINPNQHRRVFVQDVLDILSIAVQRRFHPTADTDKLIDSYVEKWRFVKNHETIDLDELRRILDEFNVDKQQITLVPDNYVVWTMRKEAIIGFPVKTMSPFGHEVMEAHHVVFYLFETFASNINWNRETRQKKVVKQFRVKLIAAMRSYANLAEGTYVDFIETLQQAKILNDEFGNLEFLGNCRKMFFMKSRSLPITLLEMLQYYKQFGITDYSDRDFTAKQLTTVGCQKWQMEVVFLIKYLDIFFDESESDLREIARKGIMYKIPMIREDVDPLDALFPLDQKGIECFYDNCLNIAGMEDTIDELDAIDFVTHVENAIEHHRIIRKVLLIDEEECARCQKTLKKYEGVRKELTTAQRELIESKKEDERLRNEMQKSFGTRICKLEENTKSSLSEIESLKCEMAKKNEEMEIKNGKFIKNEKSLKEKVTKLESDLKSKSSEMKTLNDTLLQERKTRDLETEELKQIIEQLQLETQSKEKQIQKLTFIGKEKDSQIESLIERLMKSNSLSSSSSSEVQQHLLSLQSIRNALLVDNPGRMAGELIRKFNRKAATENMKRGGRKELLNFNVHLEQYQKAVENNIEAIEKNVNIELKDLPSLPEFPKFSDEFMVAFEKTVKPAEVKECYICIEDMLPKQEKTQCKVCNTEYHTSCLKQWLVTGWNCPICKKDLVVE